MGTAHARPSELRAAALVVAMATLATAAGLVVAPAAAALQTITVTTNADSGPGSLRAAMEAATFAGDDVTIVIPPDVGDITLTTGEVDAETHFHDLTVIGSGETMAEPRFTG